MELQNSQNFTRFWTAVAAVINSFRIFLVSLSLEQVSTNLVSEYFGVPVSQILLQLLILALVGTILGQCLPENGWRWCGWGDKMSFEFEGEGGLNLLSEVEPAQLRWWVFQSSWNTNCVPNLDLSIWWCWNRRWWWRWWWWWWWWWWRWWWWRWWWWWWWWWWCDVVPWQLPQRSQEAIHGRAHVLGSRSLSPGENQDFHCDAIINNYDISNLKLLSAPSSPGWKQHRHLRAHSGPWWEEK